VQNSAKKHSATRGSDNNAKKQQIIKQATQGDSNSVDGG